jgi:steroid 5-alpha reductase family enzyme
VTGTASVLALSAAVSVALMLCVWALSLALRDASVVDSFWGPGFALIAWAAFAIADGWEPRKLLVSGLVTLWGARLAFHITRRNRGAPEDYRYAAMRRRHGRQFWLVSLGTVFGLQALLMWVVSLPVQAAQIPAQPDHAVVADLLGTIAFLAGLTFEVVGDRQLARFRADPANQGEVMGTGLWRYTRHPNYFGDALLWWGLFVIALSDPGNWWAVVSPLVMSLLLTRISGVPLLERRMARRKPAYREYMERTSAFVPLPPRRSRGRDRRA